LEVDPDVVKAQIAGFKATEAKLLKPVTPLPANKKTPSDDTEDSSIAKVMEEMKSLPSRVAERLMEGGESARRRRTRRIDPRMIERMIMSYEDPRDPIGLLMASSLVREDAPWLYELAIESYRVVKSGKRDAMIEQLRRVDRVMDVSHHTPFMEEMVSGREQHWLFMEFPRMLIHVIDRAVASLPPAASSPPNKKKRAPA
jgi:hypothetical protein